MANKNTITRLLLQGLQHQQLLSFRPLQQYSHLPYHQNNQTQIIQNSLLLNNARQFTTDNTSQSRNEDKQRLKQNAYKKKQQVNNTQQQQQQSLATSTDHLPKSLEVQDDLDLKLQKPLREQQRDSDMQQPDGNRGLAGQPSQDDELSEKLTYSQEYYILNREELLRKRREKEEEAKFGDYSAKLVKRPQKNFLWGFGTQVHDESKDFFTKGKLPTIREIIRFLEVYQMKDISVVNLQALGRDQMENYAIVCSGFSVKHLYNTAKILNQEIKNLECPDIVNKPKIAGRRDDSWFMLTIKEIQVHMILHEYREDLDLEFRWLNPPPQEMVNKWKLYEKFGRRSENIHVNEDTFKEYQYYDDKKQREFRKSKSENKNAKEVATDTTQ